MALNPFRRNKTNNFHQPDLPAAAASPAVPPAPLASNLMMPPDVPGTSYAAFPTTPSYGAFPDPGPSYGGFPPPTSYSAFPGPVGTYSGFPTDSTLASTTSLQPVSYVGFPQPEPASYIGFPTVPDPSGPPTAAYSGFPTVPSALQNQIAVNNAKSEDMMSMPEPAYSGFPTTGGTVASAEPSYGGFPSAPTYSAFPEPGDMPAVGDQFHRSESGGMAVAYNDQVKTDVSSPATTINVTTPDQPETSAVNPPDLAVAAAKSEDMMATAPALPPTSVPAPEVPHAMVSADVKMEQSAAPVAPDNVGAVAAGTSPTVTPPVFQNQVETANFKTNDMMSTDVTLPVAPPPAEAPPTQPFSALDPSSNIHTPGAQIE